jgi:DNA (cytosine-5)-methyltransferase 1
MRSIELFAGAGGLAFGVHRAGFTPEIIVERDADTCTTIRANQARGIAPMAQAQLFDGDVKLFDYACIRGSIDVISGGPPCQPFSMGGKHRANQDVRDMFPEAVRAVRALRPRAFLFENVKGLTRQSFATYFAYIQLQLTYPEIARHKDEAWIDHLARLEQHHTSGSEDGLFYRVIYRLVNAADYGVPQRRERVFIVGFRSDIHEAWSFPEPTHSQDALLWSQYVTRNYWEQLAIPLQERQSLPSKLVPRLEKLRIGKATEFLPWVTVRQAIGDLPDPQHESRAQECLNHVFRPGARAYKGHTGSPIDEPAKALKAGDHGVPGGENMVVYPGGRLRYFTVRESARLQGFPDEYFFPVSWTESMRQLGNAVPVTLGEQVAKSIAAILARK